MLSTIWSLSGRNLPQRPDQGAKEDQSEQRRARNPEACKLHSGSEEDDVRDQKVPTAAQLDKPDATDDKEQPGGQQHDCQRPKPDPRGHGTPRMRC